MSLDDRMSILELNVYGNPPGSNYFTRLIHELREVMATTSMAPRSIQRYLPKGNALYGTSPNASPAADCRSELHILAENAVPLTVGRWPRNYTLDLHEAD